VFTSLYIGGNLAILGINPLTFIRERKHTLEESVDEKEIEKQVQGMKMSDAFLLRMFKTMGLSEQTMVAIEKDLREQQKMAEQQKKDTSK